MSQPARSLQTSSTSSLDASADREVALSGAKHLFRRLGGQLGAKFGDLYAGVRQEAWEEWAIGLRGFGHAEIDRGLAECSNRKFAPTLGEFKQFCRPALDPEYAWHEAAKGLKVRDAGEVGHWSHPAVFRAAVTMSFDLRRNAFSACRVRWTMELREEFENGWGDDVPPVPKRVEHRSTAAPMPESVRALLAEQRITFQRAT